jgi:iron complex transport system ATP-binding protein
MDRTSIIELINLEIGYSDRYIPSNQFPIINKSIVRGELIGLIGRNGVGKSTLLRTITNLQLKKSGEILLNGKPIDLIDNQELSHLISYIPAEPVHAPNMTVKEFISLARYPYHGWFESLDKTDWAVIHSSIDIVHIKHLMEREIDSLSDGERQRAMIAFALSQDTDIILMDEPTAFLDLPTKFEIIHLLKELSLKGKTIIFSTHDLQTSFQEVDKFWLMLRDEIISGSPMELAKSGAYNKFFEGTNVFFDTNTGNFASFNQGTNKNN